MRIMNSGQPNRWSRIGWVVAVALVTLVAVSLLDADELSSSLASRQSDGIFLSPLDPTGSGQPDTTVTYDIWLENQTGAEDSFDLTVLPGSSWTTTLSLTQTDPLADGEGLFFTTWVQIPPLAVPGDMDTATIQVTSVSSPTLSNTTTLTTTAGVDLAYVTLSGSDLVALVDTATHSVIGSVDVGAAGCNFPWRATMSPDGDYVYVGCYGSGNVAVIETAGNTVATVVAGIPNADGVAFTRDGAYALVGSRWSAQIAVIDTATYFISFISTPAEPRSIVAHPYLDRAYATCADGTILVIDTTAFSIITAIPVGNEPWDVAIAPGGQWVFAGDRQGAGLAVIDTTNDTLYTTVTGLGDLTGLEIAPDGSEVYACGLWNGVHVVDGSTFDHITTVSGVGNAWEAAVTCDGSELYVGNVSEQIPVIDTATYSTTYQITMPGYTARGIAICPQHVASGVVLSPPAQTNSGARGEVVAHEEILVNATGATDSFDLVLGSHVWDTALSTDSLGPIADGDSATFTLYVTVPTDVDWYSTDTVVVTATSVTDPTVYSDTASFTTEAYAPPAISVSPEELTSTQYVNEIVQETLTISNGNGVTLTFELGEFDSGLSRITACASPSGSDPASRCGAGAIAYVTLKDSNLVSLVDTATHSEIGTVDVGAAGCYGPWRATMSPDRSNVYVGCRDSDNVAVIETAGNSVVATVEGIHSMTGSIAFTRDGAYALVGSREAEEVAVVDTATHSVVTYINTPHDTRSVAAHPFQDLAYATSGDGTIQVIDTTTFSITTSIPVGSDPHDVDVSPDGQWVFASSRWGDGLAVIDADTNTVHTTVTGLGDLTGLEVAPDGSEVYACGLGSGVHVIDGVTFDHITTVAMPGDAWQAAVTCDGSELYVGTKGSAVPVMDTATHTVIQEIPTSGNGARGIAICPQHAGGDVPWLSVDPISGAVPTNSSVPIQVTFDATGIQPDSYSAQIVAWSNDPMTPAVFVPVAMTVEPTANMGWVEGAVTDAATGDPLEATIIALGQPYTVTTDPDTGAYLFWLDEGSYTLQVSAEGYVTETADVDIVAQQGTSQDFALVLDVPVLELSYEDMHVSQEVGEIATRLMTITNAGPAPLEFEIGGGSGVSFFAASTELYGYDVPDGWLRVVGTEDDTQVQIINLETGAVIDENPDLDRYGTWDVYPDDGTFYKVESDKPVLGYESDFDLYSGWHNTFVPSLNSGPVGREFIFFYGRDQSRPSYVFAMENASVEVYDTTGNLVASQAVLAGEYWELSLADAVYHVISTGRIAIELAGVDGYTTVPSSEGNGVGDRFYFVTDGYFTGAFAVFAYEDADADVYDLDTGSLLYSQHIDGGDYWWQTGVGTRRLRLESTGKVEVWGGDAENGNEIEYLGDDVSFAGGDGAREYYLHSLMDGSVIFALFDNTQVDVDGDVYDLNKDEYLHLDGCCYFRHIQSNQPILIQTLGRDSSWNNLGTYLGGVSAGGGNLPRWLSTEPITGTVPAYSSLTVQVTFDATGLQPGDYTVDIIVQSNDPVTPSVSIPVTMTVEPTANMGWVEGTVTDAGTGDPLEATIIAVGQPYTITTDPDTGAYTFWLDEGSYTVQVSAEGYVTATADVDIVAQQGTTQDFALVLNVPVMEVSPETLEVSITVGHVTMQTLTIGNNGPAPLAFELIEFDTSMASAGGTDSLAGLDPADVGTTAYVTLRDANLVSLVDTATDTEIGTVNVGSGGCYGPWRATMSRDGDYVYIGCRDSGNIAIIETASNTLVTTVGGIDGADGIAFTRDGAYALVGSRWNNQVAVVDTAAYSVTTYIYTPSHARSVAAHPYLELAYATSGDGTVQVIDTTTFSIIASVPVGSDPHDVAVSPDGQWVFAGSRWGDGLAVVDADSNTLYTTVTGLGDLTGLEVAPDGSEVYACGLGNGVHVIDGVTFSHITTVPSVGDTWEAAVTCDGSKLYVGNKGDQVPVIDTTTYSVIEQIPLSSYGAHGIAICPQRVGGDIPWLSEEPSSGTVPGYDSVPVEVTFDATGMEPGEYAAEIIVLSSDPVTPWLSVPVMMTVVEQQAALSLVPPSQEGSGLPGATVVYTLTVTNLGNDTDTFSLEASGIWTPTPSVGSTGPLGVGESFVFTLEVAIPDTAEEGSSDLATITARSEFDLEVSSSAEVTTTALPLPGWQVYLPLVLKNSE